MTRTLWTQSRQEWSLAFSGATCLAFLLDGGMIFRLLPDPIWLALIFLWLFAAILASALSVVRHAEHLALRLGEPYGTLLLTLSVTFIEVMSIAAIMLHGENNPTLTRDTVFAVVMIILNGMVGLSLLLGGWRHREQSYNLQGANTYLGVIISLVGLSLILPNFTQSTPGPTLTSLQDMMLVLVGVGLYATFLAIQVGRHRGYFSLADDHVTADAARHAATSHLESKARAYPLLLHAVLLIAHIMPVVFLAEQFAHPVDYLIETLHAPPALGGVIIAALVATPEAISAVSAAMTNHLQRSVNIFLGSVLSTAGLTVPAMILVSQMIGREIILGVEHADSVMLMLTLTVSVVTFASGRTNVMQGAVHLVLFIVYLLLIFQD
jgi:Ca2+:H+ antiporter